MVIWKWLGPERIRGFLWNVSHATLVTNERRRRHGMIDMDLCPVCAKYVKNHFHVLKDCESSWSLGESLGSQCHNLFVIQDWQVFQHGPSNFRPNCLRASRMKMVLQHWSSSLPPNCLWARRSASYNRNDKRIFEGALHNWFAKLTPRSYNSHFKTIEVERENRVRSNGWWRRSRWGPRLYKVAQEKRNGKSFRNSRALGSEHHLWSE